jgi:ribonuclease BN (tRNA processing enzyme)
VAGDWGHLNNEQAASLLAAADTKRLHTLVVGHISQQNNALDRAAAALSECAAIRDTRVIYACQGEGFDWLDCCSPSPELFDATG